MERKYVCSLCHNEGVKLWRPHGDTKHLICAKCAEQLQVPLKYDELIWEKNKFGYWVASRTGKKILAERWAVDENGQIPGPFGPLPAELSQILTDQLVVNLKDIICSYSASYTTIIPAIPTADDGYRSYSSISDKEMNWWKALPTK